MTLPLDDLDRDGALRETEAGLPGETRHGFLLATLAGGGAALAALTAAEPARAATRGDVAILNYALVLEYLQSAFYTEAERRGRCARRRRGRRPACSARSSVLT